MCLFGLVFSFSTGFVNRRITDPPRDRNVSLSSKLSLSVFSDLPCSVLLCFHCWIISLFGLFYVFLLPGPSSGQNDEIATKKNEIAQLKEDIKQARTHPGSPELFAYFAVLHKRLQLVKKRSRVRSLHLLALNVASLSSSLGFFSRTLYTAYQTDQTRQSSTEPTLMGSSSCLVVYYFLA
jgi:hypothetical protein